MGAKSSIVKGISSSSMRVLVGAGIGGTLGAVSADPGRRISGAVSGGVLGAGIGAFTPNSALAKRVGWSNAIKMQARRRVGQAMRASDDLFGSSWGMPKWGAPKIATKAKSAAAAVGGAGGGFDDLMMDATIMGIL